VLTTPPLDLTINGLRVTTIGGVCGTSLWLPALASEFLHFLPKASTPRPPANHLILQVFTLTPLITGHVRIGIPK